MTINIRTLEYILENTPANQNIMLCGNHGIGKSEIITKFYEAKGMKVVPLFIGQMSDPGDIIGLPNKNLETGVTEFMLPWWFPVNGEPIVLFLDELNRARPELLQVVMDLVLNRKIAGKSLPEGSIIVSAINEGDEYTLTDLDPALISRFNIYKFRPDTLEWLQWAVRSGVNDAVISFISDNDNLLDYEFREGVDASVKSYDRRSWKRLSDILNKTGFENSRDGFRPLVCGIIGDKAGALFFDYMVNGTMVTPEQILTDFDAQKEKIRNYDIIKFMILSDRLCAFINREDIRRRWETEKAANAMTNLIKFFKFLANTNRENMAYLANNYNSGAFPNFGTFVATNREADTVINQFISSIEVR